jgi:hypothetical protein
MWVLECGARFGLERRGGTTRVGDRGSGVRGSLIVVVRRQERGGGIVMTTKRRGESEWRSEQSQEERSGRESRSRPSGTGVRECRVRGQTS